MKLDIKALAIAAGLIWGLFLLLVGVANLVAAPYGQAFLEMAASVYPGYTAEANFGQVILGTLYGLVDGAIGGAIFAWLYNCFVKA